MKTITLRVAKEQLNSLIGEVRGGDAIVLTDGDRQVTIKAARAENGAVDFDLEQDSAELAAELLKAAQGPFTDYSRADLEAVAERVLRDKNPQ